MVDRSVVYRLRAEIGQFKAQMVNAGESAKKFGDDLTGLDRKGEKMRRGLDELAGTSGRIGLALGGAFAASVVKAANFEQAMSFVQAATHETAQNMEQLRQAALDAGQSTVYSATESAAAIEELAKAGVTTEQILNGGLNGALNLAAAGGLDVAKAAEAAASAMTQFGLAGKDVPHIADLLAAGAGKAQGSVEDMSMALNQSGLVAAQTGLSIEETTGALSAFASAGLTGSDAGTSFKTMLQSLTPSSKQARDLMDQLGISAYDAQGNFVGLTEFADSLRAGLSELSVEQQNAALKTIFGSDAVRAAAVIYEQGGKGIQEWIDKTNDSGYAAETAGIRMDNLKGDLEQLGGALETLLIGGGSGQTGFLRELTQGVTGLVDGLNALPGPVQSAGASLVGIAAVGAGAFWFTSKAVSTIAETRTALAALEFQAGATKASLVTLGKSASVFAIVAASIPSLLGDLDSWNRRKAAMDASAESFDQFAKSIADSNVGKYAQDFGIDIQKLAQDLYANGESGEYASQVMAELEGRFDGFGDSMQAIGGDILPFYKDAANKAYDASHDLGDIIKNNGDLMGAAEADARNLALEQANLAGSTLTAADAANLSAAETEEMAEALQKARDGAYETASGFVNLGESLNDPKKSLGEWITELNKQGKALREFMRNAQEAGKKGLDEGLIQSLQDAGVEGALRLEQLANASDSEIRRANRAFLRGQAASEDYAESVEDLAREILGLPKSTDVVVNGKTYGAAQIRELKRLIDSINNKTITLTVNRAGAGVSGLLGGVFGSASGGTVPGQRSPYGDKVLSYLAPGEEVVSNRDGQADRWRPLLKAINANALAGGGTVGSYATGGTVVGAMGGLPAISTVASFRELNRALADSTKALERERTQRDAVVSKMTDLRSTVRGNLTSDLFGQSSAWSSGSSIGDALGIIRGDIADSRTLQQQIKTLRSKGLDGGALASLLASGDSETIANFAAGPRSQLQQYEAAFNQRNALAASIGRAAGDAAFGAELKQSNAELKALNRRVDRLTRVTQAEHREDRKSNKRGASDGARNIKRGGR